MKNNDYKRAEAYLYKYKEFKKTIQAINLQINQVKRDVRGCGAIDYSTDRLSESYNINRSVENEVIAKERRLQQLEEQKNKLMYYIDSIDITLGCLTEEHRKLYDLWYYHNKQYTREYIIYEMNIYKQKFYKLKDEIVYSLIETLEPEKTLKYIEKQFFVQP